MITPSAGYLLIRVLKAGNTTSGGLYLPEDQKEEPMTATVLEIGKSIVKDGTILYPPEFDVLDQGVLKRRKLKVGDTIYYKRRTQHELNEQLEVEERIAFLPFDSVLGLEDHATTN